MGGTKTTLAWRQVLFVGLSASLPLWLPLSVLAQGSGPPRGMEALLWLFIAVASVFVLLLSTVLFAIGRKVLFKDRRASRLEKLALFAASVLASCVVGVVMMIAFDIR